jgi:carbon storage regulator
MDIVTLSFKEPLIISIGGTIVKLTPYKTQEPGNIKFGIDAPLSINVHREEIYKAIQTKQHLVEE